MFIDELYINFLLGFLTALLFSGTVFWIYYQKWVDESRVLKSTLLQHKSKLHSMNLTLTTYKERLHHYSDSKKQMQQEFENIAQNILSRNSDTLTKQNRQHIRSIIDPFAENIAYFQEKIENYYSNESKERFSLSKEIHNLQKLNIKISEDAVNLTNALKGDNKTQGEWGEMILERVLESSGLVKGREYLLQPSYEGKNDAHFRPDVVITLPQKKHIVIDAKVSLTSYERYYHDTSNKKAHLKDFLHSLHTHIKQLSDKSYQELEGLRSLDFVLLFIPIEGAFALAQEADRELFTKAYQKNIILVSPTTLLAVLRVIENSWRFEYQNKNAQVIARKAGDLYDKFANFVLDMQKIEHSLGKAQESYSDAFKKLSTGKGNLMNRANELKSLEGVVHKKEIVHK